MGFSADTLRPIAQKTCRDIVGHTDGNIINAAIQCILQNNTKEKASRYLTPFLGGLTPKFVTSLFNNVENYDASDYEKRKNGEDDGPVRKKKRFQDFEDIIDENPGRLRQTPQEGQALNVLEEAKKQIENRKRFLKSLSSKEISKVAAVQTISAEGMDRAQKAAEINARVEAAMLRVNPSMPLKGPTPLLLDKSGQRVDVASGETMVPKARPSLLANVNVLNRDLAKQENFETAKAKEETRREWAKPEEVEEISQFKDHRLVSKSMTRKKRAFNFHEAGKFVNEANLMRKQNKIKELQEKINARTRETGIQQATALLAPRSRQEWEMHVPEVEWWDSLIQAEDFKVTKLIEHPEQQAPSGEAPAPEAIGLYLTKKERKKMRRLNRKEVQKEEQEKIRLGLLPAPEPKVKLANMMRVLDSAAVADPTKVEKHVREQMAKRQRKHEQDNLSRKLTDEQKREKKIKKLQEDTSISVKIAIYRIRSLKDAKKKFKIEMNSKQLYMTGATILNRDCSMVVVEGGPKSQRKFKRLMMNRINWKEDTLEYDDGNHCELVWEGESATAAFGQMIFKLCATTALAREFFKDYKCEHYWDLAHSKATITSVD